MFRDTRPEGRYSIENEKVKWEMVRYEPSYERSDAPVPVIAALARQQSHCIEMVGRYIEATVSPFRRRRDHSIGRVKVSVYRVGPSHWSAELSCFHGKGAP